MSPTPADKTSDTGTENAPVTRSLTRLSGRQKISGFYTISISFISICLPE